MPSGRSRFTQPILIKAEPGLRAAVADVARLEGKSLSALIREHLRDVVASRALTLSRPGPTA